MSKFVSVNLEFTDSECLKSSLAELGYTDIEEYADPQPLYGFQNDRREQTANIIIRRKHIGRASNDIGFVKNSKGTYDLIISEFDKAYHGDAFINKLPGIYGVNKVKKQVKSMGYMISSQKTDAKGRVKIKILVP